jgi:hypothetical protein
MKDVASIVIDYRGNGEPTQVRASLWYGTLLNEQGETLGGIAAEAWGDIEARVKLEYPGIKPTYTLRGWNRNVDEFEMSRHYRR